MGKLTGDLAEVKEQVASLAARPPPSLPDNIDGACWYHFWRAGVCIVCSPCTAAPNARARQVHVPLPLTSPWHPLPARSP